MLSKVDILNVGWRLGLNVQFPTTGRLKFAVLDLLRRWDTLKVLRVLFLLLLLDRGELSGH